MFQNPRYWGGRLRTLRGTACHGSHNFQFQPHIQSSSFSLDVHFTLCYNIALMSEQKPLFCGIRNKLQWYQNRCSMILHTSHNYVFVLRCLTQLFKSNHHDAHPYFPYLLTLFFLFRRNLSLVLSVSNFSWTHLHRMQDSFNKIYWTGLWRFQKSWYLDWQPSFCSTF